MYNKKIIKAFVIISIILFCLVFIFAIITLVNTVGGLGLKRLIDNFEVIEVSDKLIPYLDEETGYYTFKTDRALKILMLSDVHIGAGFLSFGKDMNAIEAVYNMIKYSKPDLVIVTGDMAYPIAIQSGEINNLEESKIFAKLMEKTGIPWTVVLGNHDSEDIGLYDRKQIADFYESKELTNCLFQTGKESLDGYGNFVINIKNSNDIITQSLFMFDSHAYNGSMFNYDYIKADQVNWYEEEIERLTNLNKSKDATCKTISSLVFLHIPLEEYKTAWYEYMDNGYKDTDNVKYIYGKAEEGGSIINTSPVSSDLFSKALELGSTKGFFCGHNHLNNFSLDYKGIRLTFGMSIDYLAYIGIWKKSDQRGLTTIYSNPDGNFDCSTTTYKEVLDTLKK